MTSPISPTSTARASLSTAGAVSTLPAVTSYTNNSIDYGVSGQADEYADYNSSNASYYGSGTVGLLSLPALATIVGEYVQVLTGGAGSEIELPALTSFQRRWLPDFTDGPAPTIPIRRRSSMSLITTDPTVALTVAAGQTIVVPGRHVHNQHRHGRRSGQRGPRREPSLHAGELSRRRHRDHPDRVGEPVQSQLVRHSGRHRRPDRGLHPDQFGLRRVRRHRRRGRVRGDRGADLHGRPGRRAEHPRPQQRRLQDSIGQGALGDTYLGTASYGGGQVRLDEQGFVLPAAFQSATLTDIILLGYGNVPDGEPFLAAATVATSNGPVSVNINSLVNANLRTYSNGGDYPARRIDHHRQRDGRHRGRPDDQRQRRPYGWAGQHPERQRQPAGQHHQRRRVQRPGDRGARRRRHQQLAAAVGGHVAGPGQHHGGVHRELRLQHAGTRE